MSRPTACTTPLPIRGGTKVCRCPPPECVCGWDRLFPRAARQLGASFVERHPSPTGAVFLAKASPRASPIEIGSCHTLGAWVQQFVGRFHLPLLQISSALKRKRNLPSEWLAGTVHTEFPRQNQANCIWNCIGLHRTITQGNKQIYFAHISHI